MKPWGKRTQYPGCSRVKRMERGVEAKGEFRVGTVMGHGLRGGGPLRDQGLAGS